MRATTREAQYITDIFAEPMPEDEPVTKGGQGSGNFGHAGRPGEVGGSSDDGGGDDVLHLGGRSAGGGAKDMLGEIDRAWPANPMGRGYAFQYGKEGPVVLVEISTYPNYNVATNTYEEGNDLVHINSILVGPEGRGQGVGTKVMKDIIERADRTKTTLHLTPKAFGTGKKMTTPQLKAWYSKLGFTAPKYDKDGFVIGLTGYIRKPK